MQQIFAEEITDDGADLASFSEGKKNTEILIVGIFLFLIILLLFGYFLKYLKEKDKKNKQVKKKIFLIFILIIISFNLFAFPINAICPVCTAAVGVGLSFSKTLGVDDLITSLWIGGLIVSTIYWIIGYLEKKNWNFKYNNIVIVILMYGFVLIPLVLSGMIGAPLNTLWGIDKVFLGIVLGSLAFFIASKLHFQIKAEHDNKVYFPFQKVIIPVMGLWLITVIFYIILYYY